MHSSTCQRLAGCADGARTYGLCTIGTVPQCAQCSFMRPYGCLAALHMATFIHAIKILRLDM